MANPPQSFALSCWLGRGNLMEHPCCPLTACHCSSRSRRHPCQKQLGCVSCGPERKVPWDKKSGEAKSPVKWKVWWDEKSGHGRERLPILVPECSKAGYAEGHAECFWNLAIWRGKSWWNYLKFSWGNFAPFPPGRGRNSPLGLAAAESTCRPAAAMSVGWTWSQNTHL